jgi:hypothetical protein
MRVLLIRACTNALHRVCVEWVMCWCFVDGGDLRVAAGIFITSSYDSTSHFESATEEVVSIYEAALGQKFDFSKMTMETKQDDE